MEQIVIVNCFDTYEDRIDLLTEYFINNSVKVTVIQSDFKHIKKTKRTDQKENFIFVKSNPYYKNISFSRLYSHYQFSKNAFKIVEKIKPEILYVVIPPNSLAKFAGKYKKKNKKVKLIYDLIDLWPETMPIGKIKSTFPFSFWRMIRDKNLKYADYIITECNLYQEVLSNVIDNKKASTLYLAKQGLELDSYPVINMQEIHLCYLGSINNIIDIEIIKKLVKEITRLKPVVFHIIGDGERKEQFINELKSTGAYVNYYGKIYNQKIKQDIFDKCHFGLNVMKDSVCVGLTMKSIDYFQSSLPIINNIPKDTYNLVEKFNIGINIRDGNLKEVAKNIVKLSEEELLEMRQNTKKVFDIFFSINAFNKRLNQILKKLHQ